MRMATAEILNTIRDNASANYRDYIPEADPASQASVRQIGGIIMNYPALQNEFLSALMNRNNMSPINQGIDGSCRVNPSCNNIFPMVDVVKGHVPYLASKSHPPANSAYHMNDEQS